jgi:uncharacterized protein
VKSKVQTEQVEISGCVNLTGSYSRVIKRSKVMFVERIAPGAFEKALQHAKNIKLLAYHDEGITLGSIKHGNLKLWEDNEGLKCECVVFHPEIIKMAKEKKLDKFSFGFRPLKEHFEEIHPRKDGVKLRVIEDMELTEVSILDKYHRAAYQNTLMKVRIRPLNIDQYLSFHQKEFEFLKTEGRW